MRRRARPVAHLGVLFLDELPEFSGTMVQTHLMLCGLDFPDRVNDALPLRDLVEHL
jgi:hypothetical protein